VILLLHGFPTASHMFREQNAYIEAKVSTYKDLFADPQVQAIDEVRWVQIDTTR
jgi:hypothetical protein